MPVSTSYLTFVLDQLAPLGAGAVTSKRMFGGIGLYFESTFFGIVDDDIVYLKVDDASRPEYEQREMPPFCPVASKPAMVSKNYYQLPGEILDDPELLVVWAKRALQAARSPSKRARKKPAGPKSARRSQ